MSILIKTVRVHGFRGLTNFQIDLAKITVLTGVNNSGKTSLLKAIQIALGHSRFIGCDDFFIKQSKRCQKIIIDLLIVPVDDKGNQCDDFSQQWESTFKEPRIQMNDQGNSFIPLRTQCTLDPRSNELKTERFILPDWPEFQQQHGKRWFEHSNPNKTTSFNFDEIPFFYMEASRDILDDLKQSKSYLGKMLANIDYSADIIKKIEVKIEELNEMVVEKSEVLKQLKNILKDLDPAIGNQGQCVEITPFTKKIRDLNQGINIYYGDDNLDSFAMRYHGMGTRSWSSLLTLKAFINQLVHYYDEENSVFFPFVAIEEPEAHLHPNGQKKLFGQINEIAGQKIISTHSPYGCHSNA